MKFTQYVHNLEVTWSLADVMKGRDSYFTSNSTLLLHPGTHRIEWELVSVTNISNLTLQGYHDCENTSELSIAKITRVNTSFVFSSISTTYCSIRLSLTAAVFLNIKLESSTGSHGYEALAAYHSSVEFNGVYTFSNNTAETAGGAIYTKLSNLTFSGRTRFTGNTAEQGGVVCAKDNNTLSFSGSMQHLFQ